MPKMTQSQSLAFVESAESGLVDAFVEIDRIALLNSKRILEAFRRHRIAEEYFAEKTGYGIDDPGRAALDAVFADAFGAESAAVRLQFVSGTHALACALIGNLKVGDRLVCLTGTPYDTLHQVIGLSGQSRSSLKSLGMSYEELDLCLTDLEEEQTKELLRSKLSRPTAMVYIQKSRGYSMARPTLDNGRIKKLCQAVKAINPALPIMVDNCYGEFVEEMEPTAVGANLIAGSLIKNPGGGLAVTGGYIAGDIGLVNNALDRLTAPGVGGHLGVMFNQNRLLFQGLFLAPSVVSYALKGAHLFAAVFEKLGYEVSPNPGQGRGDIIQAIKFGEQERLVKFLRALQHLSPVASYVSPEPADMPGYDDKVVMAGGSFIEGSTLELSADGPLRQPYAAYVQGGLSYMQVKMTVCELLQILP